VSVPFGVIGIIYEARPNVTFDVYALCLKAGSSCLLKGGSDARDTNAVAVGILRDAVAAHGLDRAAVTLLPVSHEATAAMLTATGYVALIIPRGSKRLIDYVRDNSRVPVIETGAGVCHTYLHRSGRVDYARDIVFNAKTRRPSVCNTLDTLIVDRCRLADLAEVVAPLASKNVKIYADPEAYAALDGRYEALYEAADGDFGREWLDYKMSIATVEDLDEALAFIARYGSHHSESIVADDDEAVNRFGREVDAACVYANVSTAFTDGGQFGFGAEIGISTQKLHARGPMALPEITTYKYIITGSGQTR
jgi:glutamate-5-semialdehyde dehydrogenase